MGLAARDLRIEEATAWTRRFAASWVVAHGVINARADDVHSDCQYCMVILAGEWDETRGVPWMPFLGSRLKHRLIDELRTHTSRPGRKHFTQRARIRNPEPFPIQDEDDVESRAPVKQDPAYTVVDPGYEHVDQRDELERLLRPHDLRTRRILRARLEGWTLAEIGVALGVTEARVHQIIRSVKPEAADLTIVRAVVAVRTGAPTGMPPENVPGS